MGSGLLHYRLQRGYCSSPRSRRCTTSAENPRPARKRDCFACSCAVAGNLPNFFSHTACAASNSPAVNRACAASSAVAETPFCRNSCRIRGAPNLRRRMVVSCSMKRASDSHPRLSNSSSSASICSASSAKGCSLALSSWRECSRRVRAFRARARRLKGGEVNSDRYSIASSTGDSGFSATCARILFSISLAISGCSLRKSRVLSLPWPMRSLP